MTRLALILALALAGLPLPAAAHPHIFVDTGVRLLHDADGRVAALEITWTYDELFSLLLLEDLGLDDDYDGVLRPDEVQALQGFDMDWPEGFEGDVFVEAGGAAVALGDPDTGPAALLADGRLTSRHTRALARAVDPRAEPVVVKVYDPTFYTAYSILPGAVASGHPDCKTAVFTPDLDGAYDQLLAALDEVGAGVDDPFVELDFPAVGDLFAEEVRLTCGAEAGR